MRDMGMEQHGARRWWERARAGPWRAKFGAGYGPRANGALGKRTATVGRTTDLGSPLQRQASPGSWSRRLGKPMHRHPIDVIFKVGCFQRDWHRARG